MKKIGCFRQDGKNFNGNITTLQFSVQARLVPNERKTTTDAIAPDYLLIHTKTGSYHPEIGHAWQRYTREDNVPYLEIEIDDPTCQRPILATLWRAEDGLWYLFWNRYATGDHDAEKLLVQEELKPPMAWQRAPQKMTAYLQELFPQLVI
jgi:uncharacterized protein (DUF736 family)